MLSFNMFKVKHLILAKHDGTQRMLCRALLMYSSFFSNTTCQDFHLLEQNTVYLLITEVTQILHFIVDPQVYCRTNILP